MLLGDIYCVHTLLTLFVTSGQAPTLLCVSNKENQVGDQERDSCLN